MLDEVIKRRIIERYEAATAEGKLLSRQKIDQCYVTFRSRFGPDQLGNLDGEALLTLMHDHGNRDSLAYWLEFKNDDEFPRFGGSIAGGSALKFGVFRRAESGEWATYGDVRSPVKEISVEQAVEIARKHREQLLRGVEALQQLSPNGSDDDYRNLQGRLDEIAPDVSDLAWGHKYFSLLYPDKLDDLHSPEWQRFHLLKMLQKPPEGKGRYLCAGRFVSAAAEVNLPLSNLTMVLHFLHPNHRYWRVGTSSDQIPRNRWELMRNGNCVAIGWAAVGDLSTLEPAKEGRERLQGLLQEKYPVKPPVIGRVRSQILNFVREIAEGDVVLAADGATVIGIGRVIGDYTYDRGNARAVKAGPMASRAQGQAPNAQRSEEALPSHRFWPQSKARNRPCLVHAELGPDRTVIRDFQRDPPSPPKAPHSDAAVWTNPYRR